MAVQLMATKLVVEVVEARNLFPKDGVGTSSPYVVVDFDGQRRRTRTVARELNPSWNEALEFEAAGGAEAPGEVLEVDVYHDRRVGPSRRSNFLGRLRLDSRHFVRKGEEVLMYFPLQRKSLLSWVRGDLGLKIYYAEGSNAAVVAAAEMVGEEEPPPPPQEDADKGTELPEGEPSPEAPADARATLDGPTSQPPDNHPRAAEPEMTTSPAVPVTAVPTSLPVPGEPEAEYQPPPQPPEPPLQPKPIPRPPPPPPTLDPPVEKSSFDLVNRMQYLFIRIVRARFLPADSTPHVRISLHGRHVNTGPPPRPALLEWDGTFAFYLPSHSAAAALEVTVWDSEPPEDLADDRGRFLGGVCFDTSEAPVRAIPDSPLAAQWYRLEGGRARRGDLMLATWVGTQADESFHDSCKVEDAAGHVDSRSKVYLSPKLWYLRASILEAQDLPAAPPVVSVKAALGFQTLHTRSAASVNGSPSCKEDLIFVVAEPLADQSLELTLEISSGKEQAAVGTASIPLSSVERRVDDRHVASRWIVVDPPDGKPARKIATVARLHVRVCLDGGYHVEDEPSHATSDYRPSARQLWKGPIGTVEVGIIGCRGLLPTKTVDGRGTADAYVLAKYGPKWARTRTLPGTLDPSWNEQYTWDVYEVSTVVTVAVFDNTSTSRPMGRVRIRVSTLDHGRTYRAVHPLLLPLPSGVKRTGELELAVRFTQTALSLELLSLYLRPVQPTMHHLRPISASQGEQLRFAAAMLVAEHLSRAEPPLRRETVLHVLEAEAPPRFSFRRVRANWQRLAACLVWVDDVVSWARHIATWRNPAGTIIVHLVLVLLVWCPELVLPAAAIHVAAVGAWRYGRRPRGPAVARGESAMAEEMDEEMDAVPSARGCEVVRARYDRLRAVGLRLQELLGEVATQAERAGALLTWRDPRATGMFILACLVVSAVLLMVPMRMVAVGLGFYHLRHPALREGLSPPTVVSFFRRLPSLAERYV